jgi:hypothetical protein
MKKTKPNARERRKDKVLQIVGASVGFLFVALLAGQALSKLSVGDTTPGESYWLQPTSPVIQMLAACVALLVGIVVVTRVLKKRK